VQKAVDAKTQLSVFGSQLERELNVRPVIAEV
jgi:hypothetical protein